MFSSEYSHGATSGSASATFHGSFTGTEGPEAANRLVTEIKIQLGQLNSLHFLTTTLQDLVAEFPTPVSASSKIEIFKMEKALLKDWNKAYWTVRAFFKTGSPAADQIKVYDDTADLPELWRTLTSTTLPPLIFLDFFPYSTNFTGRVLFRKIYWQNSSDRMISKNGSCR